MLARVDSDWFVKWSSRQESDKMALAPTQIKVLMRAESKEIMNARSVNLPAVRSRAVSAPPSSVVFRPVSTLIRVHPTPSLPSDCHQAPLRAPHVAPLPFRRVIRKSENAVRISEFLFLGNLRASRDDRLLCRLGIQCMVDLSGLEERNEALCPCPCPLGSHARPKLRVQIEPLRRSAGAKSLSDLETEKNADEPALDLAALRDINEFLEAARRSGRRALVHDGEGGDDGGACGGGGGSSWRAPAVVVQYLTREHRLRMRQALGLVRKAWPVSGDIAPSLMDMMHAADKEHRRRVALVAGRKRGQGGGGDDPWLAGGDTKNSAPFYAWD